MSMSRAQKANAEIAELWRKRKREGSFKSICPPGKTPCTCSYTTVTDRLGELILERKTEPKCPVHGTKATEA